MKGSVFNSSHEHWPILAHQEVPDGQRVAKDRPEMRTHHVHDLKL